MAWNFYNSGNLEAAEQKYKTSIELHQQLQIKISVHTDLIRTQDGLGLVYLAQGRREEAINVFQLALAELAPMKEQDEYQLLHAEIDAHLAEAIQS